MNEPFVGGELSQYNKLYSIGVLPKVKGRYLSSQKINDRIKEKLRGRDRYDQEPIPSNRYMDYQMAKDRLHFEMRKAQKDYHLERRRKDVLFPHLVCKTEQSEDSNPQKKVHTVEINKLFNLDNSPVRRRIFTLGIHKKILPNYSESDSPPLNPRPHKSLLRIIVKKTSKSLITPSHRSIEKSNKPLKIRINEQPFQFSQSSSDKVDLLQRQIDICEVRLGKPLTLRKEKVRQTELKKQPHSMRIHNNSQIKEPQTFEISKPRILQEPREELKQFLQQQQPNSKSYESICRDLDNLPDEVSWSRAVPPEDRQWRWK